MASDATRGRALHLPDSRCCSPISIESRWSVVLVESDIHDVVPSGRVVAFEALVRARPLLACELL